ncbi:MGDG synthase family glycosyltransferase [Clostridium septicum]|uniref:MGDG synthase family glycosyltransferase n=1 Tax=Clostridium septicum TaxID=1504 RepID=UPI000831F29F|nr:glycosyltransferase [Clostridium septicum]
MNILILTGKFGMGHNSVAKAIAEEFEDIDKNNKVVIVDLLEYLFPIAHHFLYKGFEMMINKCHGIYNMIYRFSEQIEVDVTPLGNKIHEDVNNLILENKPNFIICTLPLCAKIISEYKEKTSSSIPLITCITDISTHKEWQSSYVDNYFVPTSDIKEHLLRNGINKSNIFVTGIPVRRDFKNIGDKLVINNNKKVLIMGGGLGLLPDIDRFIGKLSSISNVEITIITGKNKKAFKYLKENFRSINVVGYTEKVNEYMKEADLIITKAGGITLFEAIHSQTPLFVINPFLEQEKKNAAFIEEKEIGKIAWGNSEDYLRELENLLTTEETLNKMSINISKAKKEIIEVDTSIIVKELYKGVMA